jgi:hypothetical protein
MPKPTPLLIPVVIARLHVKDVPGTWLVGAYVKAVLSQIAAGVWVLVSIGFGLTHTVTSAVGL